MADIEADGDNILKALMDALNGIAWKDDAQVVAVTYQKQWSEEPFVTVEIIALAAGEVRP